MKVRPSVLGFIGIVAVLIVLVWLHGKKAAPETPPPVTSAQTNVAQTTIVANPTSAIIRTNAPISQTVPNSSTAPPSKLDKGQQMTKGLSEMNDVPINFYGKLEDQFGNPIVGAQITASERIYNGVQSTVERFTTMSDGNGFFQIKGDKGESLGIMPKKEGYVLATTSTEFKYSYMYSDHFSPDPNNPTVIKMWKLQGAEPLVEINQRYKFRYTDSPICFDLVAGKIVPSGGDIKITINRSPGEVSERTLKDWSVQLDAVNGGFIETSVAEARVTYAAPEEGYQSSDNFVMSTTPPNKWFGGFDKMLFLESRNDQVYSKVDFSISINQNPDDNVSVEFHGVANTNGSRNWEATVPQ